MPTVSPSLVFLAMIALSAAALISAWLGTLHRARSLRRLAEDSGWTFSAGSQPELARAIAPHLPLGAADVRLFDCLRRPAGEAERVVARVDFCLGSAGHRRNATRILSFERAAGVAVQVVEADPGKPWLQQYRMLLA